MPPPSLHQLLKVMLDKGASDLHITTGSPPQLRIDGDLVPLRVEAMTPVDTKQLCYSVLTDAQKMAFEENLELDFSFGVKGLARFRANLFMQRGAVAGAFRLVPFTILPLEELGLPKTVSDMCERPRGLVLVTGPTGSGKSTTLASMLDRINTRHRAHIITIEDPIEFLHPHKNSLVNQREVGADTKNFEKALRHILRQDPDVVLIGEMRDLETIEAALTIAETGHLCLATLHTTSAIGSVNRIVDVFPAHQQSQIRQVLSFVLEGIISQTLIPRASGTGQVLAAEVLIPTPAVRNLIREDKLHQVYSQMQIGQSKHGMQTLNQSLCDLFVRRLITLEDAMARSSDVEELKNLIASGGQLGGGSGSNPGQRRGSEVG
ncbi:MAG: type IV pilus twitching motility protein PilT [Myxococcales bacterium]|nr:type IV pilus twitching motility protein PilT [Myxococcales bacterium]